MGTFEEGKEFDALLVDVNVPGGPFDIFDGDTMEDQFEKFINLGDDRNIVEVYVQGKLVKQGDVFTGAFLMVLDGGWGRCSGREEAGENWIRDWGTRLHGGDVCSGQAREAGRCVYRCVGKGRVQSGGSKGKRGAQRV